MKINLACLIMLFLAACLCEGRKKGSKRFNVVVKKNPHRNHKHHETRSSSANDITTTASSWNTTVSSTTDSSNGIVALTRAPPTRRILRNPWLSDRQRKCCKYGLRGGKRGFICDWDRYTRYRYTNMEHRAKMKFFGRTPSKRTVRLVGNIVRYCVITGLKRWYRKCCELYL